MAKGSIRTLQGWVGRNPLLESNQVVANAEAAPHRTGLDEVCQEHGLEWVNMTCRRFVLVEDPWLPLFRRAHIPEIVTRTDRGTIVLIKMHKTVITGAVRNQCSCMPGAVVRRG